MTWRWLTPTSTRQAFQFSIYCFNYVGITIMLAGWGFMLYYNRQP